MSDEKIDLGDMQRRTERAVEDMSDAKHDGKLKRVAVTAEQLLALVRAVRAARKFSHSSGHLIYRRQLEAALAPFTDSAEVRSDGK